MSLLNALLPLEKGKEICDIHYLSPERVPRTEEGKDSIVDVYCETNDKRQFIVEMQMYWSTNFMQRVLFNSSKVYVSQLKQGADYENLQPVYSLNLIDDIFEPKMEEFYHYYRLVHDKDTKKVIDGFHLVFVELKKFKPKTMAEKKEGTREINNFMGRRLQVLWLRFLTEINPYTEEVPQELLDNPEISKAISLVEESAYNREQLLGYDMFWDRVSRDRTLANDLKRTKEQLQQVSVELKKAEQEKLDTARKLKAMNVMTAEQISEATGLTAEEIEGL